MAGERLQKLIARAGLASRRRAEELVAAGRVTVNGTVASIGDSA
ncbi:MAG: S4 domain-containing protein, partial [Candidatus Limnocylindria bacterium]